MAGERFPLDAGDIDAAWMTAALAPRHPGVEVEAVEVLDRHQLTNAHARLGLTYAAAPEGAPASVFCKLAPTDERRDAILATGMGLREARFYADLADRLDLRVPRVHGVDHDDVSGLFVLLLEDLAVIDVRISDGTWGMPPDAVAGALEELASMHARFADPAVRHAEAPWVPVLGAGSDYGKVMLRYGIEHHRERLTDAFVAVAEVYCERTPELHAAWQQEPRTLIHGDPHLGNLFLDGDRIGFLDWGIVNVGSPMRDVGYLLTMAMDIDDRRAHERDLLRGYVDALAAAGGPALTLDQAWAAHRLQAAYTVPASCQVVTFPADMTEARRAFSEAFLARCLAALDDLEVVALLDDLGLR